MRLLIVNVGSSTVKIRILDGDRVDVSETIAIEPGHPGRVVERVSNELGSIDGVVHHVVHGGTEFTAPVLVDDDVMSRLWSLGPLAPLHQAQALDVLVELRAASPSLPHVACFDTAFHATLPDEATTLALPAAWRDLGVRRFGFHGLSHAYVSRPRRRLLVGQDPTSASSRATSAPARRSRPYAVDAASTPRWV